MALSLKSKFSITTVLVVFALSLANCDGGAKKEEAEKAEADSIASCAKPVNPNGDSELALLMRDMMHSASNLREMVKQGNLPDKFPEEFLKIHTAQPTDSETKKASFEDFADNYISNLQALYNSPKQDLTKNYNAVVNACASCHSQHCPGPLKAINKLKIE
jgi:cytochrome c556